MFPSGSASGHQEESRAKIHNAEVLAMVAKAHKEKAELKPPRRNTGKDLLHKKRSPPFPTFENGVECAGLKVYDGNSSRDSFLGVLDARTLLCSNRALCGCGSGFRAAGRHSRASDGTH
jgi:hypothetical protein